MTIVPKINPTDFTPTYTPRMESKPSSPLSMLKWAQRYADTVLARDNLHLAPALISKAAARRVRQGIKAIEAYLRRFLLMLALQIEPELAAENRARPIYGRKGPREVATRPVLSLKAFPKEGIDFALSRKILDLQAVNRGSGSVHPTPIPARPYLAKLAALRELMNDPYARARRLAWHLARRRPGVLFAPGAQDAVRNRHGTEFSALYASMTAGILTQSRARPPPLGPASKPSPRISVL
ncbi:MAG: hypothetical protein AAGH90_05345 [Pseudomonadota bacterium]